MLFYVKSLAPSEIFAQGRRATEVYERPLCAVEKGHVKGVPDTFIGQVWTGKTSLKPSLVWRRNKNREHTEPEPEFLFEQQASQLIFNRSVKKIKSGSSYAEDVSWNPNCSLTVRFKLIEEAKKLSKLTEMSPQDSKQVEQAKADSQEPSTTGTDPSLKDPQNKVRLLKQSEDLKDPLMYPPVILNTSHQKTCAHSDNPCHKAEPKHLVKPSYGTLEDSACSKLLKDPFVVDNTTSNSSHECQNVENILSVVEKLPPTIKDLNKPLLVIGDLAELKSCIGEKVPYFL